MKPNQKPTQHLTDLEFGDLLAGDQPTSTAAAHLASCAFCRTELQSVQGSLASFSALSTRWAEAVAPERIPVPSRWVLSWSARPAWATAIAVTALTGLLVFNYGPAGQAFAPGGTNSAAATVATPALPPSNAELAEDNRLMLSIDQELSSKAKPAVSQAELHDTATQAAPPAADTVVD